MRVILGLSAYYHDSAAALLVDGRIVAAVQEERLSRKKGDEGFPLRSVQACLKEAGLSLADITEVVFYDKPIVKFDRLLSSYIHRAPAGLRSFLKAIPLWLKSKLWIEDDIRKQLKLKDEVPVHFTLHHQSHAASAFYPSPFAEAAVLTVDGAGEWHTTTLGYGRGNELTLLKTIDFPHSLGLLYSAFTLYCGFRVNSGEYKLMGLAPYGQPRFADLIKRELLTLADDGSYLVNQKYFNYISGLRMINRRFERLFGRPALKADGKVDQFYMDVAASIQAVLNEVMVKLARHARQVTGSDNLVMAGGVALNCVANERILKESGFKNLWVQPAAGDAGGALGAALYSHYAYHRADRRVVPGQDAQQGSYLGPGFTEAEAQAALDAAGAVYERLDEAALIERTVADLAGEKVVGWVQGRMEFGPRALGNRSILGDPRSTSMQKTMNLKIKFRESFRPFAPSVLAERARDWFDLDADSPYMLLTAPVLEKHRLPVKTEGLFGLDLLNQKRSTLPAITHVDNSARLQTVDGVHNPLYYKLLKGFEAATGCPVLINTSFNVRGEPIVGGPADAYRCFLATHIDVLAVGPFYIEKSKQPETAYARAGLDAWRQTLIKD